MSNLNNLGMPGLYLDPLLKTISLKKMSDKDMVNYLRLNLVDSASPNPSVETLLHAFLPHKYIDHTHSNSVLSLLNLNNSPIKFSAEGDSTFGPMKLETLYLDKEGEFESESENLNELTDFIFILGDLQGVINIKIDYLNGSSDILRTICSSDDYLIEQL